MKKIRKMISGTITTLLALTLLLMLFVVIASKASGGEPNFLGYQLKTVLSGSMEPTFYTGSIIALEPVTNPNHLIKGDIITFIESQGKLNTHRIVEVIKNGDQIKYKTKGDNNRSADPDAVLSGNIVAKYTGFTIPYAGYLIDFTKSKNGALLLLILPGLLLLAYSAFTIFNALKELESTKNTVENQKTI